MEKNKVLANVKEFLSLVKDLRDLNPVLTGIGGLISVGAGWAGHSPVVSGLCVLAVGLPTLWYVQRRRRQRQLFAGNAPNRPLVVAVAPLTADQDKSVWTRSLIQALEEISEVHIRVVPLKEHISGQSGSGAVRRLGQQSGADVVIWGYAEESKSKVWAAVFLEILDGARPYVHWRQTGISRKDSIKKAQSFTLQVGLSIDVRTLTLMTLGIIQCEAGAYQEAVSTFSRALQDKLTSEERLPVIHVLRGNAYFNLQRYEAALNDYNAALSHVPNFRVALHNTGLAYLKINNRSAALAFLDQAVHAPITALDRTLLLHPEAVVHYTRGSVRLYLGQYRDAIKDLNRVCKLLPEDYYAHLNRGFCYQSLHEADLAMKDYDACIRLNPKCPSAFVNRGEVALAHGHVDSAIDDFQTAARLGHTRVYVHLSRVWAMQGEPVRALAELRTGLSKHGPNPEEFLALAECLVGSDPAQALAAIQKCIELAPDKVEAHLLSAEIHHRLGDELNRRREQARAESLEREPDLATFMSRLPPNPLHRQRWYAKPLTVADHPL